MKKFLLGITLLAGIVLPTQAFAASNSYSSYLNINNESYAVQIQLDQEGHADIKYSFADDMCSVYEHASVDVSFDQQGVGTFHFDGITGTINPSEGSMTIQKQ